MDVAAIDDADLDGLDATELDLLRDLSADDLVVNTSGPFFKGAIGCDDTSVDAMHVVMGEARPLKMVDALVDRFVETARSSLFVVEDVEFNRIPPLLQQGRLFTDLMHSHVANGQQKAFCKTNCILCTRSHVRSIHCTSTDVYISDTRIVAAFTHGLHDVYVLEHLLPFLWTDEPLRSHQVRDRRIRPGITIHVLGGAVTQSVAIGINEEDARFGYYDGVKPAEVELAVNSLNIFSCNIAECKVTYKTLHAGYKAQMNLNLCLVERRTKFELLRVLHPFQLHNSGHTLPQKEIDWRASKPLPSRMDLSHSEKNTKQTMTTHHFANPPLPRFYDATENSKRKRQRKQVDATRCDPPPLSCILPPKARAPASPQATRKTDSPTSPLDLYKERELYCKKCSQRIDKSRFFATCDECRCHFHHRCTALAYVAAAECVDVPFCCDFCK